MTQETLSVAVIGAGMAGRTHADGWRQANTVFASELPRLRLATIADAYLPFAQAAARDYGYEKAASGNGRGASQSRQACPVRKTSYR